MGMKKRDIQIPHGGQEDPDGGLGVGGFGEFEDCRSWYSWRKGTRLKPGITGENCGKGVGFILSF